MRKFILGLLLFFAALGPCLADSQGSATGGTIGTQSTLAGCQYQSSPSTLSNNQQTGLRCGADGVLYLKPGILTALASQQTLTLSGTAQALTVPTGAIYADMMPEGTAGTNNACLRYRDDGTAPTAAVGFPLAPLQGVFGYSGALSALKFINATGATCTVTVNFYK